jgi:hypothetical protein
MVGLSKKKLQEQDQANLERLQKLVATLPPEDQHRFLVQNPQAVDFDDVLTDEQLEAIHQEVALESQGAVSPK